MYIFTLNIPDMIKERAGERVIKKIGSSHVIWFPESNRWMEFKEPAWFIYKRIENGQNEQSLKDQLVRRYGLPQKEALRFLREVTNGIKLAVSPSVSSNPGREHETECTGLDNHTFTPGNRRYVTRHYLINQKHITIDYGTPYLEFYIHRPFAHLETHRKPAEENLRIRLFAKKTGEGGTDSNATVSNATVSNAAVSNAADGTKSGSKAKGSQAAGSKKTGSVNARCYYLQSEALPGGSSRSFRFEESGLLKHRLYTTITSYIYGIPEEVWMSFIHASALTNGREALLLPSASGSGKSTITALLQLPPDKSIYGSRNDLFFMSDDFTAIAAESAKAYPFPAAINVKEGSFDAIKHYYDTSRDADANYIEPAGSKARFLCPRLPEKNPYGAQPVKNIIFIKYNPGVTFRLSKLDTLSALAAFHEEAWVSQNPVHARRFIDWFATLDCHRLEYTDSRKAVQVIRNLLE